MSLTLRSLVEPSTAAAPTVDTLSQLQFPYPGRYLLAEIHRQPQLAWNQAGDSQPPVFVDGPLWWHPQLTALQPFPLYWRNAWLQPSDLQPPPVISGEAPPWRPQYITTAVPPRSAFLTYASQWQEEEVTPVPPQPPAGGSTLPFIYVKLRSY